MKNIASVSDQNFEEEKIAQPIPSKPDTIKVEQQQIGSSPAEVM